MERVGEVCCTSPHPFNQQADQFSERSGEKWRRRQESDDVLEGFLKEIDVRGHEMMKKLVSRSVEGDDVPFEQVFKETLQHHFGGKPAASRLSEKIARKMGKERDDGHGYQRRERGVDDEDDDDFKNERFKVVKTVQIKEEED